MPKETVDYSNTIIYKIHCKDTSITDVYVGHTTNFIQRKYMHKIACKNLKNNIKIYNVIRCNGGWENWVMTEIGKYCCKNATEARIKEQYHYEELQASLNSNPPYIDKSTYFCSSCNLQCSGPKHFNEHIVCKMHKKKIDNAQIPKNAKFICKSCSFGCFKYSNYLCHIKTKKHIQCTNDNKEVKNDNAEINKTAEYICKCGNVYKHMSGLSRHKKTCNLINKSNNEETLSSSSSNLNFITPELVMELIKDNKEMKQIILEQNNTISNLVKNGITNTNVNTNSLNNNNNKTFNLQFFLNETCKDAMNIMDFVESIKLQLSDLEKVGEVGYTQGISNIITTNLKALDVTQRPVHCTDKKRETMYVKDDDKWEKEDDNKSKLRKAIKKVANKNIRLLPEYRAKNPKYCDSSSRVSDKYDKMVVEIMGGAGNNDLEKEDKIIHNISKCTTIEKYQGSNDNNVI
jgi:hypothetical protein